MQPNRLPATFVCMLIGISLLSVSVLFVHAQTAAKPASPGAIRAEAREILNRAVRLVEAEYESERAKLPPGEPITEEKLHTLDFAAQQKAVREIEAAEAPEKAKRQLMAPITEAMLRARDFARVSVYSQYLLPPEDPRPKVHFRLAEYHSILDPSTWRYEGGSTRLYLAMKEAGDRPALRIAARAAAIKPLERAAELRKISCIQADLGDVEAAMWTAKSIPISRPIDRSLAFASVARAGAKAGDRMLAREALGLIAMDGLFADQLIAVAEAHAAASDMAGAAQLYLKASRTPGDPAFYDYKPSELIQKIYNIVMSQKRSGDPQGAIRTLRSYLTLNQPNVYPDQWRICEVQYNVGDKEEYEKTVRSARNAMGGTYVLVNFAHFQESIGDRAGALQTYRKRYNALLDGSESDHGGPMTAELQKALGDRTGAKARLRRQTDIIVKSETTFPDGALRNHGINQCSIGDTEGARATLNLIKDTRSRQTLAFTLVRIMLQQGELVAAHEVASDPKNHESNEPAYVDQIYSNALSEVLYEQKDLKLAQKIAESGPDNRFRAYGCSALARSLFLAGDETGALKVARKALQSITSMSVEKPADFRTLLWLAETVGKLKYATPEDRLMLRQFLSRLSRLRPQERTGQTIQPSSELLRAQLAIGDINGAIETAGPQANGDSLLSIIKAQARAGDLPAALRLADAVTNSSAKALALTGAADGLLDRIPEVPNKKQ